MSSNDVKDWKEGGEAEDWWWIDFLENELDATMEKDLETLLSISQEDRDGFEKIRLLKEWVKDSDPIAEWPIEGRLGKMRENIMQAVAELTIEPQGEFQEETQNGSHNSQETRGPA